MQKSWLTVVQRWMICSLTLLMLTDRVMAQDPARGLYAGAYAQDITPQSFPITVNGNMVDQLATSAHDPLHARCIVIKQVKEAGSPTTIAIVVCDSCMIPRDLIERAKTLAFEKTGIPTTNILVSATHAHSCPTLTGVFQSDPDVSYVDVLIERIASGIETAQKQLEPARIGWGSYSPPLAQSSVLFNRRWLLKNSETVEDPFGSKTDRIQTNPGFANPKVDQSQGLVDPELSVLSIQSRSGRPIALLANYSLHYVGGIPGPAVSADYFGEFCQRVTRHIKAGETNPPFVAALSNGTSGDVNNVDFRMKSSPARQPFEQIQIVAETVAQYALKAYEGIQYHDDLPIQVRDAEVSLGVRKPTGNEIAAAEKLIATAERPLQGLPRIYARETTLLAQYPASVIVKLQAIKIGSLAIAASPCETFTETGLDLKKKSPFPQTFTISLANGYNGYLPPPEQHDLGGYETWRARSSYLAKDAEPKVRATLLRLLSELNQ